MSKSLAILSVCSVLLGFTAMEAKADYQCTYTCGSKEGQEPKVGFGRSQEEAARNAQAQNCTQYVGGSPQFFRGCTYIDNGRPDYGHGNGGWHRPGRPHWGGQEEYKCTYSCGSKPHQEPKVGFGRSQAEAAANAQNNICTQYVGGRPSFFVGCERVR